ncbi:high affinity cAMP-specific and IBMX-insensitive 3',5'-cyclic phosphodiesterase 8 [Paragonimus westermani]|uniref:Phosphodiesterase n=1 Tax=Paragonimus westermani TaxID=34504 RepID=A0A5J4P2B2_9TREM|nr:high affinity cAMP-specific and IBMX-insensitive 3',5'-cyclic phosphodiesterase 8 [Paragonimus westermani]
MNGTLKANVYHQKHNYLGPHARTSVRKHGLLRQLGPSDQPVFRAVTFDRPKNHTDKVASRPVYKLQKPTRLHDFVITNTVRLKEKEVIQLLLIFPKTDRQTRLFEDAARKLNCRSKLVLLNYESADILHSKGRVFNWIAKFDISEPVDLVVIDRRRNLAGYLTKPHSLADQPVSLTADLIRQELCEIPEVRDAVVAGLVPNCGNNKRQTFVTSTFEAGYNKCVFELTCAEDAERELLAFVHSELPLLRRCRQSGDHSKFSSRTPDVTDYHSAALAQNALFTLRIHVLLICTHEKLSDETVRLDVRETLSQASPNLHMVSTVNEIIRSSHTNLRMSHADTLYADSTDYPMQETMVGTPTSETHDNDRRKKALASFRTRQGPSRSIPGTSTTVFDQELFNRMINGRNREAIFRFHNLNATSPLCKVVAILSSSKARCSNPVAKDLQKAIDIILNSDTFISQLFRPMSHNRDPLTIDLMEGLMVSANKDRGKTRFPRSLSTVAGIKMPPDNSDFSNGLIVSNEIKTCLEGDDRWDFDIIALEKVTQKKETSQCNSFSLVPACSRPMVYLAMKIFTRFNVFSVLRVSESVVSAWLTMIQENYHEQNPYHNATHACDVLQSCAYFLRRDTLTSVFDNLEEVGSLLAAVVHDLNHPGRTNPFLVNSNNTLAILYNDIAVLESHHVALSFELTRNDPNVNIYQNLTRQDYRTIRGYIIDMVLATEMARHFEHVAKFVNNLSKPMLRKSGNHERSSVGSMSSVESGSMGLLPSSSNSQLTSSITGTDECLIGPLDRLSSAENRTILRRLIIKCSDVNNQARPLSICRVWANRIAEEYFCQTEEEKALGLPIVMPNFERQTCNIPKSQISFIDFFLKDMFTAFDTVCPIPDLLRNLESNYQYWEQASQSETVTAEGGQQSVS